MNSCITCGMPFVGAHEKDIGLETDEGMVCVYDAKDGKIKDAKDIFNGGVEFFAMSCTNGDKALAERLTRKNMKALAHWQTHPFTELDGPIATDKEFEEAMMKL